MPSPITTGWLAQRLGAQLLGPPDLHISSLAPIDRAQPGSLTFIRSGAFAKRWADSEASAAVVSQGITVPDHDPGTRALLIVPDADLAMIAALELFAPTPPAPPAGVHPTATVSPSASIADRASIGPGCSVGDNARIGPHTRLVAAVHIGADVSIGSHCTLHPGVVVQDRCSIGDHCILHPGVVIGADGFGYRPAPDGSGLVKIPHIGTVRIGSHVEIGANSCVDRAKFDETVIGDSTKIDNLVQIGHNCRIGRACVICGLCGLAGSVTLGDGVTLAGGVLIADNLSIGSGATVAGASAVMENIPPGQTWFGYPAAPHREQLRAMLMVRQIGKHADALRALLRDRAPK